MNTSFKHIHSPNYNDRATGAGIDFLVCHYTIIPADDVVELYQSETGPPGAGPLSAHYMIDKQGAVTQFVDESKRAWHAGKSYWRGITDINSHSIGIELENEGEAADYPGFEDRQIDALIELAGDIKQRHIIEERNIIGHSDIAPGRKLDPGPAFPWQRLARKGLGLWPDVTREEALQAFGFLKNASADQVIKEHLVAYGYNPDLTSDVLIQAFNTHFCEGNTSDEITLATILSLLNQIDD